MNALRSLLPITTDATWHGALRTALLLRRIQRAVRRRGFPRHVRPVNIVVPETQLVSDRYGQRMFSTSVNLN